MAFAAALVDGIRAGRLSLPRTWLVAPAALMVAAAVVSALRAPDGFAAFIATVRIGVGVLFFLTVLLVADSRENVRWLLAALVAGALAAAAYSTLNRVINPPEQLFQYFQQYRMDILAERGIAPGSPEEELYKIRMLNDFLGTFSHPNVLAAYVGLGVLVTIGLVAPHARRLRPGSPFTFVSAAILALFAAVAVYVVGATHGRAAAAGLVIALYFMIVMATVSSRKLKAVLLAAPVVAGAALVGLLAVTNTAPGALASLRFRVDYWTATAKLIRSHPWFGVGPDNFGNFYLSVRLPTAPEQIKDPHNFFVWAWAELGIGPALIKYLPERGVTIVEFIGHGVTLSNADFLNPSLYTRVMAPIRRMHQSGVRLNRVFNPQTQVHAMADLLQQRLGVQYQEFEVERSLERLNRLAERIAVPEDRYVACHNDLVAENFILLDEKWASQHRTPVYIIDWEYAGMAPACYDLGDLFQEVRVPRQNEKQMLEAYCGTDAFDQTLYMVDLYKPFADAYWFLWSMVQRQISAKSFDFYNYGRVKYENMLRTFEFLKSEYGEKI
ncbi:MAG: Choline/ethanolamine kinase [bacterium ADurb.Bin429]|nr:MAG: Choline/ethanolamine kinase [bacterium ADurb.Bin429]